MSYRRKRWVYERALTAERERDQWQAVADRYRDRCAWYEAIFGEIQDCLIDDSDATDGQRVTVAYWLAEAALWSAP